MIAINLSAAFHAIRAALPQMKARNWGRIVNIASTHGLVASAEKSAYVAAKHGMLGLTKVVALETATTGITCNAICPGWVLTPLVQKQIDAAGRARKGCRRAGEGELLGEKQPSLEFATPEQIGALACSCAREAAAQIRGVGVAGGWRLDWRSNDHLQGDKRTLPADAVALIPDGASLMIGGFMAVGTPETVVDELVRQGKRDLTVIANDTAMPGVGIGKLVRARLVRKAIVSHIGLNPETQEQMIAGEMEVDLVPQGTLIERIRAGGFGLGGILTATGVGTVVEEGKQKIAVAGKDYLVETALRADFALVQAFLADYLGNLSYALTGAQLQPGDRDGGGHGDRRGRQHRARGPDRAGPRHHARPARRLPHLRKLTPWTPRPLSPNASRSNCATACSSTSASAFRPWSRTTFRPA